MLLVRHRDEVDPRGALLLFVPTALALPGFAIVDAGWSADVQQATLQAYFLGVNLVALPALGLPRTRGTVILLCLPGLAAGVLLGGTVVLLRALVG